MTNSNKNIKANKKYLGSMICIVSILVFMLSGCGSVDRHDGKCDICGKTAKESTSDGEFCKKHLASRDKYYIDKAADKMMDN